MAIAVLMYVFGVVLMLGTDAQKHFVIMHKKGLMQDGYVKYNRNPNYFGEILLYASFNVIAQSNIVWFCYAYIWGLYFSYRMLWKDYMLSRKDGWEEYKGRTWLFLFKLCNSSVITFLVYALLALTSYGVYNNGGIEATLKMVFKLD